MSEIKGYINMPFHGESAYEIAVRHGYMGTEEEWIEEIGSVSEDDLKIIMDSVANRLCGYIWHADTDLVFDKEGKTCGKLSDCMTDDFVGAWFCVRTSSSEAGSTSYNSKYTIDGANGYLSLRDYVVWTGVHLVHIPTFEAKASSVKNTDGKYSPKSGVDGLMSSTDKAYLSDLINAHWSKRYVPVYNTPTEVSSSWTSGYLVNWCRDTGWYLGGFAKECGGHPPVVNSNHTSWILLVLVGTVKNGVFPHALQVAFDLSNGLMYMRKGWLDANSAVSGWADEWTPIGQTVTENKSDTVFVTDSTTVVLDENIKEIVAEGDVNLNVYLPEKTWFGWRCIINFSEAESVETFDVGTHNGDMFGTDASWTGITAGKTYLLVKVKDKTDTTPSAYKMYEVDNITRQIAE